MKGFLRLGRKKGELIVIAIMVLAAVITLASRGPKTKTLTFNNGAIRYHGAVISGKISGEGTVTYKNGDSYSGDLADGVYNGKGVYRSHNGWKYVGSFKDGKADGQGKLVTEDKVIYKGKFDQGVYQK